MPKIGVRTNTSDVADVRVTIEDIQQSIADIEYLLNGRIDSDNIWESKGTFVQHSPKDVVDLADSTRPITGHKLFGGDGEDDPYQKVIVPLLALTKNNKRLRTVSASGSFVLGGESSDVSNVFPETLSTELVLNSRSSGGLNPVITPYQEVKYTNYARSLVINLPSNYRVLKEKDLRELYRIDPVDEANYPEFSADVPENPDNHLYPYYTKNWTSAERGDKAFYTVKYVFKGDWMTRGDDFPKPWTLEVSTPSIFNDEIRFNINLITTEDLPTDKYLNIDVDVEFLCEEVL
jgi:hypothetical protein